MPRRVAPYKKPKTEAFDKHDAQVHIPLAEEDSGLKKPDIGADAVRTPA